MNLIRGRARTALSTLIIALSVVGCGGDGSDGSGSADPGSVTTTGSPASGSLTRFSGSLTVTNGDLSGDCTTNGSLAVTCTKTGGVNFGALATANGLSQLGQLPSIGTNTVLGNNTGSTGAPVAITTPIYYPTAATDAAVRVAASACNAGGGGTIQLPNATIVLTSALPMYSGCTYQGTGWGFDQALFNSNGPVAASLAGTIVKGNGTGRGDGTFDCFAYNTADRHASAPVSTVTFNGGALNGGGLRQLTVQNCKIGIHVGDYDNVGWQSGSIEQVTLVGNNWGIWLENFQLTTIQQLWVVASSVGCGAFGTSANTTPNVWNNGNSDFYNIQCERIGGTGSPTLQHSWRFFSRIGSLNALTILNLLSESDTGGTTTQTVTSGSGTSLNVTDGTKFAINLPVYFTGVTGSGKNKYIYFVTSISGNTITVGTQQIDMYNDESVPASNAHANDVTLALSGATINTNGFPHIELVAVNNAAIQPGWMQQLDLEGGATTEILLQGVTGGYSLEGGYVATSNGSPGDFLETLTYRDSSNVLVQGFAAGNNPVLTDSDYSSNGNFVLGPMPSNYLGPAQPTVSNNVGAMQGIGSISSDPSGRLATQSSPNGVESAALWLGGQVPALALNGNNNFLEFPEDPIGFASTPTSGGPVQTYQTHTQNLVFTGTSNSTITLPQIQANGDGLFYLVSNPTAFVVTVQASAAQKLNNNGVQSSSVTLPAFGGVYLQSAYNFNGTTVPTNYFWQVIGGQAALPASTVAGLPACTASLTGIMRYVTDANAPTYNSAVAGGGVGQSANIPVFCNGTAWTAH